MKKYSIFFLFLLTAWGCQKNDLQYFDEERPFLNIWFGEGQVVLDSLTHNFAYSIAERDSIVFNYRIAGLPVDYDRSFDLEIVNGDSDLVGVTLGSYKVPAGQYEGRYVLHVKRPADGSVFEDRDLRISLRVKPSEQFQASPKDLSNLDIVFKNAVTKPDNWDQATYPYQRLAMYFGPYSDVKYSFIIQTTGLSNFAVYFTTAPVTPELPPNTITSVHAGFLRSQCKIALEQYKLETGHDLLDEHNNPVVFP